MKKKTVYISEDDKQFSTAKECEAYEFVLKFERYVVNNSDELRNVAREVVEFIHDNHTAVKAFIQAVKGN